MRKKTLVNNQIRAEKVRLIDEKGTQIGVVSLAEALERAKEKNLDLIQVTERVDPPVCKIGDYGKYIYQLQKKERKGKQKKSGFLKGVRLRLNTALHDLEFKAERAAKFLKEGDRVKVELILRGREKSLSQLAEEKMKEFLAVLEKDVPLKIETPLKKGGRGMTIILSKGNKI